MGGRTMKRCLPSYPGLGWTGYVAAAWRNTMLLVPSNYAWLLWGWPNRFLARMRDAATEVYVLGPYSGGELTTGIDTALDVGQLPDGYDGGIWTNRVQAIAPLVIPKP